MQAESRGGAFEQAVFLVPDFGTGERSVSSSRLPAWVGDQIVIRFLEGYEGHKYYEWYPATITNIMKSSAASTSRTSTNCAPSLVHRGLSMAYLPLPPGALIASLIDPCNRAGAKEEDNDSVWTNDSDTELKCVLCMQGA